MEKKHPHVECVVGMQIRSVHLKRAAHYKDNERNKKERVIGVDLGDPFSNQCEIGENIREDHR